MTGPSERVAALDRVLELALLINADMTRGLAARGLTESRTRLVWELLQRGPSTQRELADALHVSPRNVTGLVDALVATGFVSREPHPSDRRATLVRFTEHGADVARSLGATSTSSPGRCSRACRRLSSTASSRGSTQCSTG